MTFQGNIDTIHLPTIFQLFYFSNKSGVLILEIDELKYFIYFELGTILNVRTNFIKNTLLDLYLVYKKLSVDEVKKILKLADNPKKIVEALLKNNTTTSAELKKIKKNHIKSLLMDIVGIEFGKFVFKPLSDKELKKYIIKDVRLDVQSIIMDAAMKNSEILAFFKKYTFRSVITKKSEVVPANYVEQKILMSVDQPITIINLIKHGIYSLYNTFKGIENLEKKRAIMVSETEVKKDDIIKEFPDEVKKLVNESEYFNEGYNYFKQALYLQAVNEFKKALSLFNGNIIIYLYIAVCYIYLSDLKSSIEIVKKVITIDPNQPFMYLLLGRIFFRLKKDKSAVLYLQEGLKRNPENTMLLWEMANYYYKIRKLKNAIEIYKLLLKKDPSNIDLYLKLGAIYLKEGNKKQAESAWQTALKYDPGSKIIKANLKNIDNYAK